MSEKGSPKSLLGSLLLGRTVRLADLSAAAKRSWLREATPEFLGDKRRAYVPLAEHHQRGSCPPAGVPSIAGLARMYWVEVLAIDRELAARAKSARPTTITLVARKTWPADQSFTFRCENVVEGIAINPVLPAAFGHTPNEARPDRHMAWWDVPFIETQTGSPGWICDNPEWLRAWPSGTRYDVRCLDGGAWDRPTCWGMFATLEAAITCAKSQPDWASPA